LYHSDSVVEMVKMLKDW